MSAVTRPSECDELQHVDSRLRAIMRGEYVPTLTNTCAIDDWFFATLQVGEGVQVTLRQREGGSGQISIQAVASASGERHAHGSHIARAFVDAWCGQGGLLRYLSAVAVDEHGGAGFDIWSRKRNSNT